MLQGLFSAFLKKWLCIFTIESLDILVFFWVWLISCCLVMSYFCIHWVCIFWFIPQTALGKRTIPERHTGQADEPLNLKAGLHPEEAWTCRMALRKLLSLSRSKFQILNIVRTSGWHSLKFPSWCQDTRKTLMSVCFGSCSFSKVWTVPLKQFKCGQLA